MRNAKWLSGSTLRARARALQGDRRNRRSDLASHDLAGSARRRVPESVRAPPVEPGGYRATVPNSPSSTVACAASDEQDDDDDDDDGDGSDADVAGGHGRLPRVGAPGPPKGRPGSPTLPGFGTRFAGASVGSERFAYRGLVGSYLLEIDRAARSADREQPRAQPSHAPLAARPTRHDRPHQLARRDRREQLHAPAGRTT